MKKTHSKSGYIALLGILILIFDSKTAIEAANTGIDLCIKTVIPSLFPFFLLSVILTNALSNTSVPFLRPVAKLLGIPEGAGAILVSGFLGGYPTGAQSATLAYRTGLLTKPHADRLLSFCSNAGPAFLFGMAAPLFSNPRVGFLLWGIHIVSALFVALLLPIDNSSHETESVRKPVVPVNAMRTAILAMATVCGWVIVFRVMLVFLDRWVLQFLPVTLQVVVYGILELTNGCCALTSIPDPGFRFILCSCMLAWGGVCVLLQTRSVAEGLSVFAYVKGKLLQTLFSLLLSTAFVLHLGLSMTVFLLLLVLFIQKTQKRGSNPAVFGV